MNGGEKRAYPRVDCVAEVRLGPEGDARVFAARNISLGGLFIEAEPAAHGDLRVGAHVDLRIHTSDLVGGDVTCRAQVIRVDEGNVPGRATGFGLRFFRMDMVNTMRLAKLVDHIRGIVSSPKRIR